MGKAKQGRAGKRNPLGVIRKKGTKNPEYAAARDARAERAAAAQAEVDATVEAMEDAAEVAEEMDLVETEAAYCRRLSY